MHKFLALASLACASITGVECISSSAAADQIINLPGLPSQPTFNQYAGYLDIADDVYPNNQRHIFYWHVESQNDPKNDPVVFWTNGGPGCSGLIGFFEEFGPFHPNPDGKTLYYNPYSWNQVANLVFIEAPAGVGFSYASNSSDYVVGDSRTAKDNVKVINSFLQKFDNFQENNNQIYIASESYGGHYIPTWTTEILKSNEAGINPYINFQGFLLGNPYTNPSENIIGQFGTYAGHSLIPTTLWTQIQAECFPTESDSCYTLLDTASSLVGDLDPYSLDTDVCLSTKNQKKKLLNFIRHSRKSKKELTADPSIPPYDPCVEKYETAYLNRADVQAAIHAVAGSWDSCSYSLRYNRTDSNVHMEPLYPQIIQSSNKTNKYVVFSGDADSVCGSLGTQNWIFNIGLDIKQDWSAWTYEGQVAGYITKFDGLSFVTVHGAGHEVSMIQPARGLALFKSYLAGDLN